MSESSRGAAGCAVITADEILAFAGIATAHVTPVSTFHLPSHPKRLSLSLRIPS